MMADSNLTDKLQKFCSNMTELEQMATNFSNYYFEQMEEPDNDDNVWNKLDTNITFVYANTSIYWLYLLLKETDLTGEHPIKEEITRVRKYMNDYIQIKRDQPTLNIRIAKNMIRNALWDPSNNIAKTDNHDKRKLDVDNNNHTKTKKYK
ncbi:nuclear nucleic acid-binding protein C1D-like [Dermatophagoides pteronyssinus]|uniref:Nuclear nucleic acid-binding protein C1D n=2 Tax=Dermatophagoides pteronyssinus TaxID=6956 RepID=A0A6P6Y1H2_DERPT|nr:nuclear nucleic acid-binding protein C1D-like [Dermatophagoides pteronyssinus]